MHHSSDDAYYTIIQINSQMLKRTCLGHKRDSWVLFRFNFWIWKVVFYQAAHFGAIIYWNCEVCAHQLADKPSLCEQVSPATLQTLPPWVTLPLHSGSLSKSHFCLMMKQDFFFVSDRSKHLYIIFFWSWCSWDGIGPVSRLTRISSSGIYNKIAGVAVCLCPGVS